MANIRWRKKDEKTLKNKVRNHNRKLKKLLESDKLEFDKSLLPEKLSYKELKENIKNRQDFNKKIEIINNFTKRNSEKLGLKTKKGGKVPQFLLVEKDLKLEPINEKRNLIKKQYKKSLPQDRGVVQPGKIEEYDVGVNKMKERSFDFTNKSHKEILKFFESVKDYDITIEELNERYRKNLYKSIEKNYSPAQIKKIKNVLDKIPDDILVRQYYIDVNLNISFNYEEFEDDDVKFESVLEGWNIILSDYAESLLD